MIGQKKSPSKPRAKMVKDVLRKKITNKDIEIWEVAQLSCNTGSHCKPSTVIPRVEERRKNRHERLLHELAGKLHQVNLDTEKNIKISSMELKAHMKNFDDKLQEILISINKPEVASYCSSVFVQFQNKANEYKSVQQTLVNELHEDLNKFEDIRSNKNKKVVRVICEEIRKVGYFLPYELQMFVEHETLKMNKLSLNNRRCYEDLKLTLTLLTEQTFKSFMNKVFCLREAWIQRNLWMSIYDNIQDKTEQKIKPKIDFVIRIELSGHELLLTVAPDTEYNICMVRHWYQNARETMSTLDSYCQRLTALYRKAIEIVYKGFDDQAEKVQADVNSVENLSFVERIIKPIIFQSDDDVEEDDAEKGLIQAEVFWQEILERSGVSLKSATEYLQDFGKLWTRHTDRVCESKRLILRALESAAAHSQAVLQDLEIKLNIDLDSLRQEHIETKLPKAYEAVVATLEDIKAKYESMYLEDVSIVEDFYKMMILEADVLTADIEEFIYESNMIEFERIVRGHIQRDTYGLKDSQIYNEMSFCCQKCQAITSWKQGVWVALENLSGRTREALQTRAENWVEKKIQNLAESKTIQLELTNKRFQRVRTEIYDKRLEEIESHQELFDRHKQKIFFVLEQLNIQFTYLVEKETRKMDSVNDALIEIEGKGIVENRPGIIRGKQMMLDRMKEEIEDDLKMSFGRFRAECSTKVSDLIQANIKYMKSIKLFHENGNYSSEEGKTFIEMLEAIDKDINLELKNLDKNSTKEETEMIRKLTSMFNPVITLFSLLYEETLFYSEIHKRIRNFTHEIQEVSNNVRLDFEYLTQQCSIHCKTIQGSKETPNDDEEGKHWCFIIELLYRNCSSLLYPITPPECFVSVSMDPSVESELGECTSETPCCCAGKFPLVQFPSVSFHKDRIYEEKALNCTDHRTELFNCSRLPERDGTFLIYMCHLFWEELGFIQIAACDFYNKLQGRKIIREDLIPNNYDALIGDILNKFKYFYLQVRQFWFLIISEFLPLLGRIKLLVNFYLEKKLNDYKKNAVDALETFQTNFLNCMENQNCENVLELEVLSQKLLPLHGYPHNVDLLSALEEEVVRTTAAQKIRWETTICRFKGEIKCFCVRHVQQKTEINKITAMHRKLRNAIFTEELSYKLVDIVLQHCNTEDFCIKTSVAHSTENESVLGETNSLASGEVPDEYKLDILPSTKNIHSIQTYQRELIQMIEWEQFTGGKPDSCPPCSECSEESFQGEEYCRQFCQEKSNILLEILDLDLSICQILNCLSDCMRSMKDFADSREKYYKGELYKWLKTWKFNVKKVLKLYTVAEEKDDKFGEVASSTSGEYQ